MPVNTGQSHQNEDKFWTSRNVLLPTDAEDTMHWACETQRMFRENRKKTLLLRIRQRKLKFIGHMMRKVGLANLTLSGNAEDKIDAGSQK